MTRVNPGVVTAFFVLTLISPFVFPWPVTLVLALSAGLFYPPLTLFVGFLVDLLYFAGHGWPLWTVLGLAGSGLCVFVRYIVRTRIM